MNKREKAIWNIVILISIVVLAGFSYNLWDKQNNSNKKKKNFILNLKKFDEYGIELNSKLKKISKSYGVNVKKKNNTKIEEVTASIENNFIEYKEVVSDKGTPFTSIRGFSVENKKITPGCHLLTEINGKKFKKSSCSNSKNLEVDEMIFSNDMNPILGFENLNNYGTVTDGETFADKGNGQYDEGEEFEDKPNGQYDEGEKFTDKGNGQYDEGEEFNDKGNGQYDEGEEFTDTIGNNVWDEGEKFTDKGNGQYDEGEKFTDKGNGQYDEGEEFNDKNKNGKWDAGDYLLDLNGNGQYDKGEEFNDKNKNGKWDLGEPFNDKNKNGVRDKEESYTDLNSNEQYDESEKFKDKGNGQYDEGEEFEDKPNGQYDEGEEFEDKPNGQYDEGEKFTDKGNGQYDEGEEFTDKGNGQYDEGEEFNDTIGNNVWDEGEKFTDKGNGQYDEGEEFNDKNKNGKWDYVLLKDLKTTSEDAERALASNYFFTKTAEKNKKFKIYVNTNQEIDEYNFNFNCLECPVNKLEESLNNLEISLRSQREHEFKLPEDLSDPTDLSNVVILPGYEGGYNQAIKRNAMRLSLIFSGDDNEPRVSIDFKGHTYKLKEGDPIDGGVIRKIDKNSVEYEKDGKIKTLMPGQK